MTETYHKLEIVEDTEMNIEGERRELKEGQKIYAEKIHTQHLTSSRINVAKTAGETKEIENPEKKVILAELEEDTGSSDDFDFEEYVDEHNADEVIKDVEDANIETWLENLKNHDDRVTVQDAIDEKLEELNE